MIRLAIKRDRRFFIRDENGEYDWWENSGITTYTIDELPSVFKEIDFEAVGDVSLVPVDDGGEHNTQQTAYAKPCVINLRDVPVGTTVRFRNNCRGVVAKFDNTDAYSVRIKLLDGGLDDGAPFVWVTYGGRYWLRDEIYDFDVVEVLS